ncbi:MAG TPA: ABC transporter ATP-binding protein [Petrotogaceae bacterium]|jgi:ABC-2 type transport system ATP-binding protein|nr:ABC transporter ATP-binding protein [Petrotogaceae bacterium]HOG35579.1 ABC transporter ATP-binding protein [Petrotogaceae bacterium]HPO27703.1 ABC transporter ATP-binding protein [Petrotogaceae bacterium]
MSGSLLVQNIIKTRENKSILDNISFEVHQNESLGIFAKTGQGKTVLSKILMTLVQIDSGKITINGYDIHQNFEKAICKTGSIVDSPKFYDELTAYQNLLLTANLYGDIPHRRAWEMLELTDLQKNKDHKVKSFTSAMKYRLAIARAMINYPWLLILDDPARDLDMQESLKISCILEQIRVNYSVSMLILSKSKEFLLKTCADMLCMENGKVFSFSPDKHSLDLAEIIDIYSVQKAQITKILYSMPYVSEIQSKEFGLRIKAEKEESQRILDTLLANKVNIDYFLPSGT